jgi:hypothetical protein
VSQKYATSWWDVEHWWTTSGQPTVALRDRQHVLLLSALSVLLQSNVGTMQKNINILYIPIKTFLLVDFRGIPFVHITALWLVLVPCTLLPHTHHRPRAATSRPEQKSTSQIKDVLKCVRTVLIPERVTWSEPPAAIVQICLKWNLGTKETRIQRKMLLSRGSKTQVPVRNETCLQRKKMLSLAVPYFSLCSLQLLHLT